MGTNEKDMTAGSPRKTDHNFCHTNDAWKYFSAVLYNGRHHDRRTSGRS